MSTDVDTRRRELSKDLSSVRAELRVLQAKIGNPFVRLDHKATLIETKRLLALKVELMEKLKELNNGNRGE